MLSNSIRYTALEMAILLFSYISSSTKEKTKYFVVKESLYDNIPLRIVELASETILKTSLLKKFL